MVSGKGPGFQGAQSIWLKNLIPAYLAKTAPGKPIVPGQPLPTDDHDLASWVKERRDEFETQFQDELQASIDAGNTTAGKIRESFDAYFRNRKHTAKKQRNNVIATTHHSSSLTAATPPIATPSSTTSPSNINLIWSSLLKGGTITGRKLFDDEHRKSVSEQVNIARREGSISAKMHVGMISSKLKHLWDELGERQKDWEEKAENLRAANATKVIYRNQALLVDNITTLLGSTIGSEGDGAHTIGHARFHVLYGYRDEQENLRTGSIDITGDGIGETPSYEILNKDYETTVMASWVECCRRTVSENISRPHNAAGTGLSYNEDGCPLLPEIDLNTVTVEFVRNLMSDYLEAHWSWSKSREINRNLTVPSKIPWSDTSLETYVCNPQWKLSNPSTINPSALFHLFEDFRARQVNSATCRIFSFHVNDMFDQPPSPMPPHSPVQLSPAQTPSPSARGRQTPDLPLPPLPAMFKSPIVSVIDPTVTRKETSTPTSPGPSVPSTSMSNDPTNLPVIQTDSSMSGPPIAGPTTSAVPPASKNSVLAKGTKRVGTKTAGQEPKRRKKNDEPVVREPRRSTRAANPKPAIPATIVAPAPADSNPESPVRFSKNGNPLKKSKFWSYDTYITQT